MTVVELRPSPSEPEDLLREAIAHVAHLLPTQAPLPAFVHHNTLHAFEDLPFHEAVAEAQRIFGAEPYWPESRFREAFAEGRIRPSDLDFALEGLPDEDVPIVRDLSRSALCRLLMLHDVEPLSGAELDYAIHEGTLLDRPIEGADAAALERSVATIRERGEAWVRSRASVEEGEADLLDRLGPLEPKLRLDPLPLALRCLWARCLELSTLPANGPSRKPGWRERLHTDHGLEVDDELHPTLIRLCGAYLDGGLAYWPMPHRELGFYRAFLELASSSSSLPAPWRRRLRTEAKRERAEGLDALASIRRSLTSLGIPRERWERVLTEEALALPGWAGMFHRLQTHPRDRLRDLDYSLEDYLAVRLLIERCILEHLADGAGFESAQAMLDDRGPVDCSELREGAATLYRVAQLAGLDLEALEAMEDGRPLLQAIDDLHSTLRRSIWQEAFERQQRHESLDAISAVATVQRKRTEPQPEVQVAFCIDDREESIRRHIEELGTRYQTWGIAGFYGLAIAYKGLTDAHERGLCPASREPDHHVHEVPQDPESAKRWEQRWKLVSRTGFAGHVSSRTMLRGLSLSVAGALEAVPMAMRVVAPRASHRFRETMRNAVLHPPPTRLTALREGELGYDVDEAADIMADIFRTAGWSEFAPLVLILGHGSTTSNNPHEAAYQCGACAGGPGGPNARLFAQFANLPEIRKALRARGVNIGDETYFVGGLHDTCADEIRLDDLQHVPESHREQLHAVRKDLEAALDQNAHERCRRFKTLPLTASRKAARAHVEARAHDLAQPRSEYNHCTNALCLVGRRWLQRGLFLDRRAFLVSYDPTGDPDGSILAALLASVGPVGAGINLEYYFSTVDQDHYGCGTKLPHNVTGLHGVMNGQESDLRTGLAYQMIDIHEPVRLVTVVEATVERLEAIAASNPAVGRLVRNRWIQLVAMDPDDGALTELTHLGWRSYMPDHSTVGVFDRSVDAYGGTRANVAPSRIRAGLEGNDA